MKAFLAIILATTFGGFIGVLIKWTHVPALSATAVRLIIPAIILLIYLKFFKRAKIIKGSWKLMSLGSALNALRLFFYFLAWIYTSVAKGTIILYTFPIFFTIFGAIFLKEKITKRSFILIVAAFIGTFIIFFDPGSVLNKGDLIGMLSMLMEAILFSLAMVIFKKESINYSEVEMVFWQNIVGAIIMVPLILFVGFNAPVANMAVVAGYTGILSGLIGFLLFFYALKRLKISHYSLMTYFEVVSSILFAVILLGEKLSWNMLLGGAIIIGTGLGLVFNKSKSTDKNAMVPE